MKKLKNYKLKINKYNFLKAYIKMEKIIKFGDTEVQKQNFDQHEKCVSIRNYKY